MTEHGCVFCGIVDGSAPSSPLLDTGTVLAFMDSDPVTPGHVLVIPKEHLPHLADLTDELAAEMMAVARRLAAALRRTDLPCDGVNLFYADGEAAFQEVFHAHLHVFPRFAGDGFTINARWGSDPSREELDRTAAKVVAELEHDPSAGSLRPGVADATVGRAGARRRGAGPGPDCAMLSGGPFLGCAGGPRP